ncbi:MAG: helix-turn-helix domain containing protein [Armatimonadetes bacterium]|nr:helix-turn-helix domain containing protein [Armatimonadota bacterium]
MSRRQKDPLRAFTETEYQTLLQCSRSHTAPAVEAIRAQILLRVAQVDTYEAAARAVGHRSGEAVADLVARFNQEGLQALRPRHGGGPSVRYDASAKERILREAARTPTVAQDGTATWSLSTLQKALRTAPDGLPQVSTYTLWQVLHEAGHTFQQNRTGCETGTVLRKRKDEVVRVTDPDTAAKKN